MGENEHFIVLATQAPCLRLRKQDQLLIVPIGIHFLVCQRRKHSYPDCLLASVEIFSLEFFLCVSASKASKSPDCLAERMLSFHVIDKLRCAEFACFVIFSHRWNGESNP